MDTFGYIVVGFILFFAGCGLFLKVIGKHEAFKDNTKKAGLSLLEKWLKS